MYIHIAVNTTRSVFYRILFKKVKKIFGGIEMVAEGRERYNFWRSVRRSMMLWKYSLFVQAAFEIKEGG